MKSLSNSGLFVEYKRGDIRNRRAEHWDWNWLVELGAFEGTKISPTDIDACVERHGNFLIFETKKPDEELSLGQDITLKALSKKPGFTVILIRGEESCPQSYSVCLHGEWQESIETSRGDFAKRVKRWFHKVSKF